MAASVKMPLLISAWLLSTVVYASVNSIKAPPLAYQTAALDAGVPALVLYAVALQESSIHLRGRSIPWPWTLNIAGAPYYYATRSDACLALQRALRDVPATRIDAGLAQINLGYQARHYRQPCELLDPYRNLAIAASILREHRRPEESWLPAIGRYHRPAGGARAIRYQQRVSQHMERLTSNASVHGRSAQP